MKLTILVTTAVLTTLLSSATTAKVSGSVAGVGDGDSIRVLSNGKTSTIRLACVDAPETAQQPFGKASAQRLKQLLPVGQTVSWQVVDTDRYGRTIAEVFKGNLSVNLLMVQEGQAVVYQQYLSRCPSSRERLLQAEAKAKQRKIGY